MSKPNKAIGKEGSNYKPRLFCFDIIPGLESELYEPILDSGIDAIIIGATVPSGGVPNEGKYSFIPFIEKATALEIPIYLVRGSLNAEQKLADGFPPIRRNMTKIYVPERSAIKAGAIPLERPDASQLLEVIEAIKIVYSKKPTYHKGIEEVSKLFSSPEFVESLRKIREE